MSKKEAYIERAQAKINEQVAKIDKLKAQAQGEIADKKIKSQNKVEELEAKIKDAKTYLSEIVDATEESWENIKHKFDHLAEDIGNSFKKFFGKDDGGNPSNDS